MSYTMIYTVDQQGDMYLHSEVKNAWRGAMNVWRQLGEHYFGRDVRLLYEKDYEKVWNLPSDDRLSYAEKITLMSTFDYVLVRKENLTNVRVAFLEFCQMFKGGSLKEQQLILKDIQKSDAIAVGWCQTSVVSDMWYSLRYEACISCGSTEIYKEDCDNCEDRERKPYNINIDNKHWFLFDDRPQLLNYLPEEHPQYLQLT